MMSFVNRSSAAVGFGAAIDYMSEIGFDAIEQHEHRLVAQLGAAIAVGGG